MRDTFVKELTALTPHDPRIFLITGDLGFGVLTDFAKNFPRHYLNAGVAEQNMTGVAAGMALEGRVVFTYSIANFSTLRCLEQIRNDACYHGLNVKVVSIGGGFSYGALGFSHHATEDLAIMRALPGITVVSPSTKWEVVHATRALVATPGPAYLRLDKSAAEDSVTDEQPFVLGRARRMREGTDVTLVATGGILQSALHAATELELRGIHCRVLSFHTLKPLDVGALKDAAADTGGIVTIEEHIVDGGLAGAVAEALLEAGHAPRAFRRVGLRDGFATVVGDQTYLRTQYQMDTAAVVKAAMSIVEMIK